MKVKTDELSGVFLDYAVAISRGFKAAHISPAWTNQHGAAGPAQVMVSEKKGSLYWYNPSESWGQAGPIIHEAGMTIRAPSDGVTIVKDKKGRPVYRANMKADFRAMGLDELEAAMRCYVKSQLGDVVDIPVNKTGV